MAKNLGPPIVLGVITILALVFLTGGGTDDKNELRETFEINAVYYDSGHVEVSYLDKSGSTELVVMEVLGMEESFQKHYGAESKFIEIIPFPDTPKYGWEIHPIVLEVDHAEFGHIQIKTEIRPLGEPAAPVIYSRS